MCDKTILVPARATLVSDDAISGTLQSKFEPTEQL
jgi:hypothetical protein